MSLVSSHPAQSDMSRRMGATVGASVAHVTLSHHVAPSQLKMHVTIPKLTQTLPMP